MDLELTTMRHDNTLRTFRLSTGREDWAVMSTEHYLKLVRDTVEAFVDLHVTHSVGGRVRPLTVVGIELLLDSGGKGFRPVVMIPQTGSFMFFLTPR